LIRSALLCWYPLSPNLPSLQVLVVFAGFAGLVVAGRYDQPDTLVSSERYPVIKRSVKTAEMSRK
jgi:hypothetical protein